MTNPQQLQEEFKNVSYFSEHALGGIELRNKVFKAFEKAYNLGQQDMLERVREIIRENVGTVKDFSGEGIVTGQMKSFGLICLKDVFYALNNLKK
jgi:hypothetical protein